jgi:hypothetical protein
MKEISKSFISILSFITPSNACKYIYNVCFSNLISGVGRPATLALGLQAFNTESQVLNKDL